MSAFLVKTSLSASELLQHCHLLDHPALFFSGTSGHPANESASTQPASDAYAVLTCQPTQTCTAFTQAELTHLLDQIRQPSASVNSGHGMFQSGWAGYLSYDAGRALTSEDTCPSDTPLAEFHDYPLSIRLNLRTDECLIQNPRHLPEADVLAFIATISAHLQHTTAAHTIQHARLPNWSPRWTPSEYHAAFDQVQEYLLSGDVYQVNLAMPFQCPDDLRHGNPCQLLQRFNAPFSCYFRTPHLTLFSVSPERFIRIDGETITASPIKGTIPRGENKAQDDANRAWLAASEKNRAENLMIVDLLRNDIGRSAQAGSVSVPHLFTIESHANVHHMVSTISARKSHSLSALDAIINAFPGGSITGAPKRRAMEIIDELECLPRGLYCGSFGYLDDSGLADFNILIRSIIATERGATCWGGGGLVTDSTADSEYDEIHGKIDRILETPMS